MKYTIIDVREPFEFATGHATDAINIPLQNIASGASELDNIEKSSQIIVYCRTGSRSGVAKKIMENTGFVNVTDGINQSNTKKYTQ